MNAKNGIREAAGTQLGHARARAEGPLRRRRRIIGGSIALAAAASFGLGGPAHADLLCRSKSGFVKIREACKSSEEAVADLSSVIGTRSAASSEIRLTNWPAPTLISGFTAQSDAQPNSGRRLASTQAIDQSPSALVAVPPCRLVDTRAGSSAAVPGSAIGPFAPGTSRTYSIAGRCGIPSNATVASLNVTLVTRSAAGYVSVAEGGAFPPVPTTSTSNWNASGVVVVNAAITPLSGGAISVFANNSTEVIIDTNGYFTKAEGNAVSCLSQVGKDVFFTGCNVHIRNGSGTTSSANGVGNLIVGYNEPGSTVQRSGSHNVVVGPGHSYSRFGGLVAGMNNWIRGDYSSVVGGGANTASGPRSTVTGGSFNTASGEEASVSGGAGHIASGQRSSISGGADNRATDYYTSISGGTARAATKNRAWCSTAGCFEE